jgi:hypothetical protein
MSIPSAQGLSVAASHMLSVVKDQAAVIGTRLVAICQYRFAAGTALVASTLAAFIIGRLFSELILKISDIGLDPDSAEERLPDAVFFGISAIGYFASIAAVNIAVSRKLQLPLPIWGSVLITITTMALVGLAIAVTDSDEDVD